MDLRIPHLGPDILTQRSDLVGRPAQHAGQQAQRPIFQARLDVHARPLAQMLQRGIPRPRAHRPFIPVFDDVHEPGGGHVLAHGLEDLQLAVQHAVALGADLVPRRDSAVGRHGAVVAGEQRRVLGLLEVSAGFQGAEALRVQGGPVGDGAVQAADVDEVEGVRREGPVGFHVVDLEAHVGRDPGGLNGGEVGAGDQRGGIQVGDVDGPEARAGAEVEDLGRRGRDGREKEAVLERLGVQRVSDVEVLVGFFVVGAPVAKVSRGGNRSPRTPNKKKTRCGWGGQNEPVFSILVGMIRPSVFDPIISDPRGYGGCVGSPARQGWSVITFSRLSRGGSILAAPKDRYATHVSSPYVESFSSSIPLTTSRSNDGSCIDAGAFGLTYRIRSNRS